MRQCKNISLDEANNKVRPTAVERNTLILRDIAPTVPVEDLKKLFDESKTGKVVSIRPDVENTWFVTFENQDICQKTAIWLLSQTFQGKPVKCRVKSENLVRSFYIPSAQQTSGSGSITSPLPNPNSTSSSSSSSSSTSTTSTSSTYNPYAHGGYMPYYGNNPYNKGQMNGVNKGNNTRQRKGNGRDGYDQNRNSNTTQQGGSLLFLLLLLLLL
jgi:hypothetical protein